MILCMPHRDKAKHAAYVKERRRKMLEAGLCHACSSPLAEGHKLCQRCLDKSNRRSRDASNAARDELYERYGGNVCACCGESERMFLSLDHVNNDGAAHRRSMSKDAENTFPNYAALRNDLRRRGWPPVLQVLCHNCNIGKARNGGTCPHKTAEVTP